MTLDRHQYKLMLDWLVKVHNRKVLVLVFWSHNTFWERSLENLVLQIIQ